MDNGKLSGIERQLVLQYLIDGNVPVTLTPISSDSTDQIKSLSSAIFPIALKAEHIKVFENGKIYLENPPQSVIGFKGKKVKAEFYFNKVGLFFVSDVKESDEGLCITLPDEIDRIKDIEEEVNYDFSALLYYDLNTKTDINLKCIPWENEVLFTRPVWKSIPLENQSIARDYLEKFVEQAKIEKNAGNGIQLIPICNFLTYKEIEKVEAFQNKTKPINILYVDHERIVFGIENDSFKFVQGCEYGLKMSYSIKNSPILSRDIFVTFSINKIYKNENNEKCCVDCRYTNLQEEDLRFIYEKSTTKLFI